MRRMLVLVCLFSLAGTIGCSNTWQGVKATGRGMVQDTKNLTNVGNPSGPLQKADAWVRENMW